LVLESVVDVMGMGMKREGKVKLKSNGKMRRNGKKGWW
jgi:hypothetical protein